MNADRFAAPRAHESEAQHLGRPHGGWRLTLYTIIFEADTRAGRLFDVMLIWVILASVATVVLESMGSVRARHGPLLNVAEWLFTLAFTAEYIARLLSVRHPWRYVTSFYGVIDLLALLPTYLAVFIPELYALIDIRVLRLLRVFRVLKLVAYVEEFGALVSAVAASRRKILVFLSFVLMVTLVMGTLMYLVEGPESGFTSIPVGIYWAITTLTTVGFGDITPITPGGRLIASLMMLLGWGTLAVPTGIVTAEMTTMRIRPVTTRTCHVCLTEDQAADANYCRHCGAKLPVYFAESNEERERR